MTNQVIIQALEEYLQFEQKLARLHTQKTQLEKEIKHYQICREEPKPQHPSKFRIVVSGLWVSSAISFLIVYFLVAYAVNGVSYSKIICLLVFVTAIVTCILAPILYKRADKEACAKYVTAGMRYKEWEERKQKELPILQNQLNQVLHEGRSLFLKFQNAQARELIHSDYLPYAKTILGYFERGRVKTIPEAVNLLEQEMLEHRRDMKTDAYRNKMLRQAYAQTAAVEEAAEQSRQAVVAAEDAAFWGSVATFVAATNSKKVDTKDFHVV